MKYTTRPRRGRRSERAVLNRVVWQQLGVSGVVRSSRRCFVSFQALEYLELQELMTLYVFYWEKTQALPGMGGVMLIVFGRNPMPYIFSGLRTSRDASAYPSRGVGSASPRV